MMRMSTLATILSDEQLTTVHIIYNKSGTAYKYLCTRKLAKTLGHGDYVVLEAPDSFPMDFQIGTVYRVDEELDVDPEIQYDLKWVFQKVDSTTLYDNKEALATITETLKTRQKATWRDQLKEQYGLKQLPNFE